MSAAETREVPKNATTIRHLVLTEIKRSMVPVSADQVAERIGVHFLSVRPRVTELKRQGKIRDSGQRGLTSLGRRCALWVAA